MTEHPFTRAAPLHYFGRYVSWRLRHALGTGPRSVEFVNGSRIVAVPGMTGVAGGMLPGMLHEYSEMGFLLHFLRPDDLFVDVGANVGVFTVLAGAAVGSACISIEPVPEHYRVLCENIELNGIASKVEALELAVGAQPKTMRMDPQGVGAHLLEDAQRSSTDIRVNVTTLDEVLDRLHPVLLKIDVEGYEIPVLRGAAKLFATRPPQAVILELNGSGARYGYDDSQVLDAILSLGYKAYAYDPGLRRLNPAEPPNESGNALLIRDPDSARRRVTSAGRFVSLGRTI